MLFALNKSELEMLRSKRLVPHFTGAEMLVASYLTDPAVVQKVLPRPLEAVDEPLVSVFVAKYPETNFGCVYNEGAMFVHAKYKNERGYYCVSMPVDDDMAMIGGRERLGFPKKMADAITLDRAGDHVVGSVRRKGVEILRIEADLTEQGFDLSSLGETTQDWDGKGCAKAVSHLFKFFPSPDGTGFDYLPRLVRQVTLFRPREGARSAVADVTVESSPTDPLGTLPVHSVVTAGYGLFDNTMLPGKVVSRIWNVMRFVPHAFFKVDVVPTLLEESRDEAEAHAHDVLNRLPNLY